MATMTIRNLDDTVKQRLRMRAAQHGRSMEDEARDILRTSLSAETPQAASLVGAIRARMKPHGGVDLELPPRDGMRAPPDLGT